MEGKYGFSLRRKHGGSRRIFQRHNLHFDVNMIISRYSPIAKQYKIHDLDTQASHYVTKIRHFIDWMHFNSVQNPCFIKDNIEQSSWFHLKGLQTVMWPEATVTSELGTFIRQYHSSLNHSFGNSGARQGHNMSYLDWQNSRTLLRVSDNSLI